MIDMLLNKAAVTWNLSANCVMHAIDTVILTYHKPCITKVSNCLNPSTTMSTSIAQEEPHQFF